MAAYCVVVGSCLFAVVVFGFCETIVSGRRSDPPSKSNGNASRGFFVVVVSKWPSNQFSNFPFYRRDQT